MWLFSLLNLLLIRLPVRLAVLVLGAVFLIQLLAVPAYPWLTQTVTPVLGPLLWPVREVSAWWLVHSPWQLPTELKTWFPTCKTGALVDLIVFGFTSLPVVSEMDWVATARHVAWPKILPGTVDWRLLLAIWGYQAAAALLSAVLRWVGWVLDAPGRWFRRRAMAAQVAAAASASASGTGLSHLRPMWPPSAVPASPAGVGNPFSQAGGSFPANHYTSRQPIRYNPDAWPDPEDPPGSLGRP